MTESLEDRRLLAVVDLTRLSSGQMSPRVEAAFERVSDLTQYSSSQLVGSRQWVANLAPGTSRNTLATQLGVRPSDLVAPPWIRDTYIVSTGGVGQPTNAQVVERLRTLGSVQYFYPLVHEERTTRSVPNDPYFADQWHLFNYGQVPNGVPGEDANVVPVWNRYTGEGVQIAVLDDGVQGTHPDLAANYRSDLSFDYLTLDSDASPESSDAGHGTSVAGVAAGVGNNGVGITGAAYGADIAGIRMLGAQQNDFKEAQSFFHQRDVIDISNNSWGPNDFLNSLDAPGPLAIAALEDGALSGRGGLGTIFTWAGGNGRSLGVGADSNYDGYANSIFTLGIGALDHRGQVAAYSEPGANLLAVTQSQSDIGVAGIVTTDLVGAAGNNQAGNADDDSFPDVNYTSTFGGTSSATPLASGIIALMLDANPNLTYRDIEHIIARTARKVNPQDSGWTTNGAGFHVHHDYGFGAIDALAAVRQAEIWGGSPAMQTFDTGDITPSNVGNMLDDGVLRVFNLTVTDTGPIGQVLDDINLEKVELIFTADVENWDDLEITLRSPSGTVSRLASPHIAFADPVGAFTWTFSTTHNWGENLLGDWTISVRDARPGNNIPIENVSDAWNSFRLLFNGTEDPVVNPTPAPIATGVISGTIFNDSNLNSIKDNGESGFAGRLVYLDSNNNGVVNPGEPTTISGGNGLYVFSNLAAGSYSVRMACTNNFTQTFPVANGAQTVNLGVNGRVSADFGSAETGASCDEGPPRATVSGVVFIDTDNDQIRDAGEAGVAGITVYADLNNNCIVGIGEPTAVTDANGVYRMTNLVAGSYNLKVAQTPGYLGTGGCTGVQVNVGATGTTSASPSFPVVPNFNNNPGDTPTPGIGNNFFLGALVSSDPSVNDNDGVFFLSGLHPGRTERVGIVASQFSVSPAYLHAWIDFNGDGDWNDAGEQIFRNERLSDGANTRTFVVPTNARTGGPVNARFRWLLERDFGPTEQALTGETEDYVVTIPSEGAAGLTAVDDTFTLAEDAAATDLNVLSNDLAGVFSGTISLTSVGQPDQGGTASIVNGKVRYKPAADFNGTETFTYVASDSQGGQDTATVTVTVTSVNDPPTAVADSFTVLRGSVDFPLDVLDNDNSNPDGGETLSILSFTNPSNGGVLNVGVGGANLLYTPAPGFLGQETFDYTLSDGNGGEATATVTIDVVSSNPLMRVTLRATDSQSNPLTTVLVGQPFFVRAFVQDLRANATGVFSSFVDLTYDQSLVMAGSTINFDGSYQSATSGSLAAAGLVDEVGAALGATVPGDVTPIGPGEFKLFSIPFTAKTVGSFTFGMDMADIIPPHETLVFGVDTPLTASQIQFVTTSLTVGQPGVVGDAFTVNEDSADNTLNVLANDLPSAGLGPFTIISTTLPNEGGAVSITNNGTRLSYTPKANFFGTETFSYTVRDTSGSVQTALVTMTVDNLNDPPVAHDDTIFNVATNAIGVSLDVLANDTFLPDPAEDLTIVSVGDTANFGTVEIASDGKSLVFSANFGFTGTETFTYTIADPSGATSTATVRVFVSDDVNQAGFIFEVTDDNGLPIESINVGGTFLVHVSIRDLRALPDGAFSAFLDMTFGPEVEVVGTLSGFDFNPEYPSDRSGTPGLGIVDELGAVDGLVGSQIDTQERIVSIPFRAVSAGTVTFTGDPADNLPAHETTLFGEPARVADSDMIFGFDTLVVNPAPQGTLGIFTNASDLRDVNGDGVVSPLDALLIINDLTARGARQLTTSDHSGLMIDVNRDGFVSPLDPLLVINQLNANSGGSGRAAAGVVVTSDDGDAGTSSTPHAVVAMPAATSAGYVNKGSATRFDVMDTILEDIAADIHAAWL